MRSRLRSSALFAVLLGFLLLVGLFSLRLVPVYEPLWGLDFQNVYVFQTCEEAQKEGVYSVSGEVCGDDLDRPFRYPPAVLRAFSWVGWFTFAQAVAIWDVAMLIAMFAVGMAWLWFDRRANSGWRSAALVAFWLLLMAQFPFAFGFERGGNDIVPVVLWTGVAGLFLWRRYLFSGGFAGLAIAFKIYPAVAAVLVVVGLIRFRGRVLMQFTTAGVAGGLLASVFWWDDTVLYVTNILPATARVTPTLSTISHPLLSLHLPALVVSGIVLTFFGSWAIASWRRLQHDPILVLAGVLAVSTYYSSISWDYNLITTYPLLLVVTARALNPERSHAWKVASFASVLAIAAGRGLFTSTEQLLFQIVVLVGIAWLVILDTDHSISVGATHLIPPGGRSVVRDSEDHASA